LVCPRCARDARFVERRAKWCQSLLGVIRLTRCYYHCRGCRQGHVPWDQALGLGVATLTPAASEVASIAGVQTSFAQSAEVTLQKLCGLRLSESTVERVTEAAGERLGKLLADQKTFGKHQPWAWQRDARGKCCAYVGLDATGVRQQGERASKAEGRMAYVATLYNPRSEHDNRRPEPHQVRFLAGFYGLTSWERNCDVKPPRLAGMTPSSRLRFPMAATAWKTSFARTSRWPSASSTSGTPKNISSNWAMRFGPTTKRHAKNASVNGVTS